MKKLLLFLLLLIPTLVFSQSLMTDTLYFKGANGLVYQVVLVGDDLVINGQTIYLPNVQTTGVPVDNQIAIFTTANTIEGDAGLTYTGAAFSVTGSGTFSDISHEVTDVDKFLVSNTGLIKYRTGAEVLSDIGAGSIDSLFWSDNGSTIFPRNNRDVSIRAGNLFWTNGADINNDHADTLYITEATIRVNGMLEVYSAGLGHIATISGSINDDVVHYFELPGSNPKWAIGLDETDATHGHDDNFSFSYNATTRPVLTTDNVVQFSKTGDISLSGDIAMHNDKDIMFHRAQGGVDLIQVLSLTGGDDVVIGNTLSDHTTFNVGGVANAVQIAQGTGNFQIGTTSGLSKLTVNGGAHIGGDSDAGDNNLIVDGSTTSVGRILATQGADVASANDITLGAGNAFEITGAVQMETIIITDWQNGALITLLFTSNPLVKHNTAGGGSVILLSGAGDFSASAGDTLTLILSEIGGSQAWREVARTVI